VGKSNEPESTLFFSDGIRSIDYVLVCKKSFLQNNQNMDDEKQTKEIEEFEKREAIKIVKRHTFEENLINEGLELETYANDVFEFVKSKYFVNSYTFYCKFLKIFKSFRSPMISSQFIILYTYIIIIL
jgi:Dimerisation domain of Ca+-activated chloride-channel, anoctamin